MTGASMSSSYSCASVLSVSQSYSQHLHAVLGARRHHLRCPVHHQAIDRIRAHGRVAICFPHSWHHSYPALHRPITESDIDAQLMTSLGGSPPLDILVRTSNVRRLSDYLLWQVRSLRP